MAWQVYIGNLGILELLGWRDAKTLAQDQPPSVQQLARDRYHHVGVPRGGVKQLSEQCIG